MEIKYNSGHLAGQAVFLNDILYLPVADEETARKVEETRDLSLCFKEEDSWGYRIAFNKEAALLNADGPRSNRWAVEVRIGKLFLTLSNMPANRCSTEPQARICFTFPGDTFIVNQVALAQIAEQAWQVVAVSGPVLCKKGE